MKSAMIVMSMVLVTVFAAYLLTKPGSDTALQGAFVNPSTIDGDVQTVTTVFQSGRYVPITVQVGVPVRWVIQIDKRNLNGCNNEIIIPKYNISKKLRPGDNIVEFTPTSAGVIGYSCWMGMIRNRINVVADIADASAGVEASPKEIAEGERGLPSGCACCAGRN